jgi:hypothetical protein
LWRIVFSYFKYMCGASRSWSTWATRFRRLACCCCLTRGRHPGFSPPHHDQGAAGLFGHGEFLQAVPAQHRPHAAATDGRFARRHEGVDRLEWSAAMDAAFAGAKQALLTATHLAHPTVGAELSVVVDASATHVGACSQQQLPGRKEWQPLGFFSKKLETAQQKYSAFDRELFACYAGI